MEPAPTLFLALSLAAEGPISGPMLAEQCGRTITACNKILCGYGHDGYLRIIRRAKSGNHGGWPTTYVTTDKGTAKLWQLRNARETGKPPTEEPKPAKCDFGPLLSCWGET